MAIRKPHPTAEVLSREVSELIQLMVEVVSQQLYDPRKLQKITASYYTLPPERKPDLYKAMLTMLETPKERIEPVLKEILRTIQPDPSYGRLLSDLRLLGRSPRLDLFRQFANVPGGLKFLLDFRGDLLSDRFKAGLDVTALESDVTFLLDSWFQQGFLLLQEITLDSPYRQIKVIKEHDMVHPMTNLEEMGGRLGKDRMCFALYHRLMPQEPVIFIEVALTRGITRSITQILTSEKIGEQDSIDADTAVFYSINNTQHGLTGMGLGKVLIGQVVDYIKNARPNIKNFSTLSPLPGFWKRYLKKIVKGEDHSFNLKRLQVPSFFPKKTQELLMNKFADPEHRDIGDLLAASLEDPRWPQNDEFRELIKKPLIEIAYHYVTEEKNEKRNPLNPVASFHLSNGASVTQQCIDFLANPSPRGLEESCGIMVNYIYSLHWLAQIKRGIPWITLK